MSAGYGDVLGVIRDGDSRDIVRRALDAGWEWVGYTKSGHVEIRWPATGGLLHCATTPSDRNAWKQLARSIKRVSGVTVWEKPKRKGGRDADGEQVAASRRRYSRETQWRAGARLRDAQDREARLLEAERIASSDRHRHDIESLMRPGYGR